MTKIRFNGKPALLGVGVDITKAKEAENEIRYLRYHDRFTGLYNRAYFERNAAPLLSSPVFAVEYGGWVI